MAAYRGLISGSAMGAYSPGFGPFSSEGLAKGIGPGKAIPKKSLSFQL
jgi:hypothetical protein